MAGNLRSFELNGVEVQKLHSLDVNGQRFTCTLWTEWILPGGRHDKQLASQDKGFPMVDGKPTFKPSAFQTSVEPEEAEEGDEGDVLMEEQDGMVDSALG